MSDIQPDVSISPGTITSAVHPGDPWQEVNVVGFETMPEALQFVGDRFQVGNLRPRFQTPLKRGESVRFEGAPYVVFYTLESEQKPVLLSITRCHGDLHLVLGSCGFQFLLGVRTAPAPGTALPR